MTGHILHDGPPGNGDSASGELIAALHDPRAYGHPVQNLRLIETHISWVFLTGSFAYKIKKPVDLGFLDFSTLEKRRHYCAEELRLNRRFAPEIYLELVEIRGSVKEPRIDGDGDIVEYAIRMLEFPQSCLLSARAADGRLRAETVDAIAASLATIHASSDPAEAASAYGSAELVEHWSNENLVQIAAAIPTGDLPNSYFELKRWYRENATLLAKVESRRRQGFVRDCHGDLHLGNMALIDERVRFFDCIEFNPELRWIDTVSEAAFVAMDLHARGFPAYCWRFVNHYLQRGGDYDGVALLRYYFVYRALVRAKVEALRLAQQKPVESEYPAALAPAIAYIDLAAHWARGHRAGLVLMHGLSGSGKSTLAECLVEELGAIQLRSDIERKRLFDLDAGADSGSEVGGGIYTREASTATYERLARLAEIVVDADFTVIVDAATLRADERRPFLEILSRRSCKAVIVACEAPESELRRRIVAREDDPSEANLEVLDNQLQIYQPIDASEREIAPLISIGVGGLTAEILDEIRRLLFD